MSASTRKILTAFNFNIAILKLKFSSLLLGAGFALSISKSHSTKLVPAQKAQSQVLGNQWWTLDYLDLITAFIECFPPC